MRGCEKFAPGSSFGSSPGLQVGVLLAGASLGCELGAWGP